MAIGDAAAAAGLTTYSNNQDIRLGYENDNQRGDDIAAVMGRAKTLEDRNTVLGGIGNQQSSTNGTITIVHGLGRVPKSVSVMIMSGSTIAQHLTVVITEGSLTRTNFSFRVIRHDDGRNGEGFTLNTVQYSWMVIG